MLRVEKRIAAVALPRKLLRPAVIAALSIVLTRADFLRGSPLTAALTAACLAGGEPALAPVIGCILGALRLPIRDTDLIAAICCASVLACEIIICLLPRLRGWIGERRACVTAAFGALIPAAISANGDPLQTAQAVAGALMAGAGALFIGTALRISPNRTRLSSRERIGAFVLIGGCVAGFFNIFPPIAQGAAVFSVLLLPACAPACAVALLLCGGGAANAAAVALCGFVSDMRIYPIRRLRAVFGVCACGALYLAVGAPAIIPSAAACGVYAMLGDSVCGRVSRLFSGTGAVDGADVLARQVTLRACDRVRALGDAFDALADDLEAAEALPDEQELICEMRARLCGGCSGYGQCWMGADNRGAHFLCRLIAEAAEKGDAPVGERVLYADGDVPPDVLRACRRGRMIPERLGILLADFARRRCELLMRGAGGVLLHNQMIAARDALYALADRQSAPMRVRRRESEDIAAALDAAGLRGCRVTAFEADARHIIVRRPERTWNNAAVAAAKGAVARAIGCNVTAAVHGDALRLALSPRLTCDTGASAVSAEADMPSGDSYLIRNPDESRVVMLLSDGMGVGRSAAEESLRALHLMWNLIRADVPAEAAADIANRDMLLCGGDERFATLDLCVVDLCAARMELTKLAAARTVILRNGRAIRIEGAHLPMGILECARGEPKSVRVADGDIILMGSDGLMEVLTDADILSAALRDLPARRIADQLVAMAAGRRARMDDITCLACVIRSK